MMMTTARLRQIGWGALLTLCFAAFAVLSLSVHAVRNEAVLAENQSVALKKKRQRLETEFQARASQHQLARWNRVDLGFVAPRADQYLEGRNELIALGLPRRPDAPAPVRFARADAKDTAGFARRKMVSPVSGRPITLAALNADEDGAGTLLVEAFGDYLITASPIRPAKAQTVSALSTDGTE